VAERHPGVTTETELACIERDVEVGLADLGLRLDEAKRLTAALQAEMVPAQMAVLRECPRTCLACGRRLASKGYSQVRFARCSATCRCGSGAWWPARARGARAARRASPCSTSARAPQLPPSSPMSRPGMPPLRRSARSPLPCPMCAVTGTDRLRQHVAELLGYLEHNEAALVPYAARRRQGEPIATSFVESAVDEIIAWRMAKAQQMRWSRATVQPFLDVRTTVLNDTLEGAFRRYPGFRPTNDHRRSIAEAA